MAPIQPDTSAAQKKREAETSRFSQLWWPVAR
jgi:hypothetical protein